jgi:hypothetical protein
MKTRGLKWMALIAICLCISCQKEELSFQEGDIQVEIKTGDHWLHDYPLFLGLHKKNPPQFAIWLEDTTGKYITTVFATYKVATEGWISNNGNRRQEALPHWAHKRGVVYPDGIMLPTKDNPLTDGITGATPKEDKTLQIRLNDFTQPVVIKAEFNNSVDFNDYYTEEAKVGYDNYSGGSEGSGQPAVIYAATINRQTKYAELQLIGHSSSDGSNGNVYTDLEKLTSAKSIVGKITVTLK